MTDLKCKKCRSANQKLFLKGERCFSQKCALIRKPYHPGVHGKSLRRKLSEYGQQLAEKQKLRWTYGISERQFRNYFKEIAFKKGDKESLLIDKLERRLDNVIFRLGWAKSRALARQLVSHGHILVNQRKVNIPSYQVAQGDVIQIKERSKKSPLFKDLKTLLKKHEVPAWLSLDKQKLEAKVVGQLRLEDVGKIAELNMVIEYYSR